MATNLTYSPSEASSTRDSVHPKITGVADNNSFVTTKEGAGELIKQSVKQSDCGTYSVRYAISDVKNVFAGTDVDPALYGAVKRGKNLLIKMRHTGTRMENNVPVHYPIEVGLTFKYPVNVVNGEDLEAVFRELLDALYESTAEGTASMPAILSKLMLGSFPR